MPFLPAFEKDVSKCGSDDRTKAEVRESPGGMLAAGTAGEVLSGDKNLRALVARVIEDKCRVGIAGGVATPVEKQEVAVAGALNALEELLGNDLVGVDVGAVERCGQRRECTERFH
jgi:hypothetical protein